MAKGKTAPRLGAHMSIAGGLHRAVDRAAEVGATALQVFVKSSRQWATTPLKPGEARRFREALQARGLARHTLAHSAYLINLAATDATVRRRSLQALRSELRRCARLGIPYLVLHPGSHLGDGEEAGLERVVQALDRTLGPDPGDDRVTLLLETTAGQGSNLGHRFEQLAWILDRVGEAGGRLGVCFDTCHVFAAGYELRDARSYRATLREFDRRIGLARLKAFHLNDSKGALGSRRDRHEHVGRGELGLEPFRLILNDRRFADLPMVLETPKGDDLAEDHENLGVLRRLVRGR